ncbi:RNA-binding S4 domain-containing protein [Arthrobacter sp. H41]|uniref:RNA-binding S4 domain-containing protein n=1 Tax=Arthrobacter sp. H41 TaxID=1312978 RepID=UPI00047E23F9|nr:RNA-binding S4 domain-containing protein [Arthrobacter sp. H41]
MSGEDTAQDAGDSDEISIRDDMIRLGQLLKLASLAEDGVEAKALVDNGLVQVNGEIEERRGRQLHPGDTVSVNGQNVRITRG